MTRLLVADDHEVVLEGVKAALARRLDLEIVGEAVDGREVVAKVEALRPQIVIMDIVMPHLNGIEATRQIKKRHPAVKVIIYTMYDYDEYIVPLFRAGISGLVFKGSPISDLYSAIEAVRRGGVYFGEDADDFLSSNVGRRAKGKGDPFESLSLRQREVFELLAEGHSVKEVAALLRISPKTVETHKYHIMEKLQVNSMVDWTKQAVRRKIIRQ